VKADVVKEFGGDADKIVKEIIFKNKRACETLQDAAPVLDWLAVSVDGFGVKNLTPAVNLFAVGDSAAFIDPFTGSGMLMALESAKILAECIAENRFAAETIADSYKVFYRLRFQKRLLVCSWLRQAAFVPNLAALAIGVLGLSRTAQMALTRATRPKMTDYT
jgi:flavin-dependent dehydrogenase